MTTSNVQLAEKSPRLIKIGDLLTVDPKKSVLLVTSVRHNKISTVCVHSVSGNIGIVWEIEPGQELEHYKSFEGSVILTSTK